MSDHEKDKYFKNLASGIPTDTRQVYRFEFNRLLSYISWPKEAKAFPTSLARVGLYYLKTADTVACFVCNVHIGQWEEDDLPLAEHTRHSPNCDFILGRDVGNVPLLRDNQSFNLEEIRKQEEEIRAERARVQSEALATRSGPEAANNVMEQLQKRLLQMQIRYPFSVLEHHQRRPRQSEGKAQMVLGSTRYDYLLERLNLQDGNIRDLSSMQAEANSELPALTSPSCDFASRASQSGPSPTLSIRQQQIHQAVILISTEPVRPGVTEYCPLDVLKSILQSANHPQYAHINRRVESYATWPYSHVQSPLKLAEAGFYYTGNEDRIRCFLCNGGLCNWEIEDIPWYEHCIWFERCRYAVACMKNPVVFAIVSTAKQLRSSGAHSILEGETQCDFTQDDIDQNGCSQTLDAETGGQNVDASHQKLREHLLDMGFSADRVNRLIEMIGANISLNEALEFLSSEEFPASLPNDTTSHQSAAQGADSSAAGPADGANGTIADLDQEDEVKDSDKKEKSNKKKKKEDRKRNCKTEPGLKLENGKADYGEDDAVDELKLACDPDGKDFTVLKQENEDLKSRRACKVCMEKEVCIIFLPCSHLVCCLECALQLNECPLCRGPIKGTVKVYM